MGSEGEYLGRHILEPLLINPKKEGGWLMSFCPAHPDGTKTGRRSLGLSAAGVLKCYNGCSFKEIVTELKKRNGIAPEVILGAEKPVSSAPIPGAVPTDVFDYKTPDGQLIAQKARFVTARGKRFQWRMPGVHGWPAQDAGGGLQGITLADIPLLNSEEVSKWAMDDWVFFTEGEKARQAVEDAGGHAVCHGGGASTHDFGESLMVLGGRKVAIWPDNDPDGRKYALRVQRELKGIAEQTRIIVVPTQDPKDDAYEYFNRDKGTIDAVLDGTFEQPLVEKLGEDHVAVTVATDIGPVRFDFDFLQYEHRNLTGELVVQPLKVMAEPYVCQMSNLLGTMNRNAVVRACTEMFGAANWQSAVTTATSKAKQVFTEAGGGVTMGSITATSIKGYTVEHLVPSLMHSIIFGSGESCKTWLAYGMAASVASGVPILDLSVQKGGVIIVDYESGAEEAKLRMERILAGAQLPSIDTLPIHFWAGRGIPLANHAVQLRRYAEANGCTLLIVDSGGRAIEDPKAEWAVTSYFNALDRVGISSLTICHINKFDADRGDADHPMNSIQWTNQARRTFFVSSASPTPDIRDVAIIPKKKNKGRGAPPLSYRLTFTGAEDEGPVLFDAQLISAVPAFEKYLSTAERVYRILERSGVMRMIDIMKELDWQGDEYMSRLRKVLAWGKEHDWFDMREDAKRVQAWAIGTSGPAAP